MNRKQQLLGMVGLLGASMGAHAALLNSADLLTVDSGSWLALDTDSSGLIEAAEMANLSPGADGGLLINYNRFIGAIDSWMWAGQPGHHYTTSPVTGGTTAGLDFSGWSIYWNGAPGGIGTDLGAWTPTNCTALGCDGVSFVDDVAAFSWSGVYGDSYSLWYSLSYLSDEPGTFIPVNYIVHLQGTVQSSLIPVPAAVWLFGSGLAGLLGMARRKVHRSMR